MSGDACANDEIEALAGSRGRRRWLSGPSQLLWQRGDTRQIWALAWPAMLHAALVALVFTTDRLLVGHLGPEPLASLQISTTLSWTAHSVLSAGAIGAAALVGRQVGAGADVAADTTLRAALVAALIIGMTAATAILVGGNRILPVLFPTASPTVARQAWAYLETATVALPCGLVAATAAACLQAAGDTTTPLGATLAAALVNLVLSTALVFGLGGLPALGVRGAAVGTAWAFALEALVLCFALTRRRSPLKLRWHPASGSAARASILHRLARVSLPAAAERLLQHSGYLAYVMILATLGADAMAANQALISIESWSWLCAEGFGIAAAARVAQQLGAGRPRQAAAAHATAVRLALIAATTLGLLFALAPSLLLAAFSPDPAVCATGLPSLYLAAATQPAVAFAVVSSMALRGAGDTRTALAITFVCAVVVRLGVCWLLVIELQLGLSGAWLASGVDWLLCAALLARVFARGRWLRQPP